MTGNGFDEDEPLLEGLERLPRAAFEVPAVPGDLRNRVLKRSSAMVRARPRRRRTLVLFGMLAAYAAGLGTMVVARPETHEPARMLVQRTAPAVPGPAESTKSVSPAAPRRPQEPLEAVSTRLLMDPKALARRIVRADPEEQLRLLQRAGDWRLNEVSDVHGALCYYRQLLDLMPAAQQRKLNPEDSWLLLSLKQARQHEERYNENAAS